MGATYGLDGHGFLHSCIIQRLVKFVKVRAFRLAWHIVARSALRAVGSDCGAVTPTGDPDRILARPWIRRNRSGEGLQVVRKWCSINTTRKSRRG
jgi:hypothetical protein